jgi:hypothetical protein
MTANKPNPERCGALSNNRLKNKKEGRFAPYFMIIKQQVSFKMGRPIPFTLRTGRAFERIQLPVQSLGFAV